jgi:hypothetical protein
MLGSPNNPLLGAINALFNQNGGNAGDRAAESYNSNWNTNGGGWNYTNPPGYVYGGA